MTKAEKLRRSRSIRTHLQLFQSYQTPSMQEHIRREWGRDPDEAALDRLLSAQRELGELIELLTPEPQKAENSD